MTRSSKFLNEDRGNVEPERTMVRKIQVVNQPMETTSNKATKPERQTTTVEKQVPGNLYVGRNSQEGSGPERHTGEDCGKKPQLVYK